MRISSLLVAAAVAGFVCCSAGGDPPDGIISPVDASRAGLAVQWFSQLDALDADTLAGIELVVDENRGTTFFEVSGGGLREVYSEFDLGPDGKPLGVEGGAEFAEIRREFLQAVLDRNEKEATIAVEKHVLPWTTLYTISNNGMLNAVDAETGKLRWRTAVGSRLHPTSGMGASKRHVAVINGSTVWCLDASTGKTLWSRKLERRVTGAPVVNDHFVFVPTSDGRLESIPLTNEGRLATVYVANGNAVAPVAPVLEGDSVAWATSRGVTVAPASHRAAMRFRINTDSPVVCPPAAHAGVLFVASREGYLYAVAERTGALLWSFPLGERISQSPVALGDDLFVIDDQERLHRFDARTGLIRDEWSIPATSVRQYIGASQNRLYVLDAGGSLLALDRNSGSTLAVVGSQLSLRSFANLLSDRLYVCHTSGLIQCLREAGSERPMFHGDDWTELAARETPDDGARSTDLPASSDPFGGDSNPFGGNSNPFGSDNPFGPGTRPANPPAGSDPFSGGNADPFSGNSGSGRAGGGGSTEPDPFAGGNMGNNAPAAGDDPFAGNQAAADPEPEKPEPAAPAIPQQVLWKDVEEIFQKNCAGCHGKRDPKAGFDVTTYTSIMRGSVVGSVITRNGPDNSRLYKLIIHQEQPVMPPRKKLKDDDIALIRQWIIDGARLEPKTF